MSADRARKTLLGLGIVLVQLVLVVLPVGLLFGGMGLLVGFFSHGLTGTDLTWYSLDLFLIGSGVTLASVPFLVAIGWLGRWLKKH